MVEEAPSCRPSPCPICRAVATMMKMRRQLELASPPRLVPSKSATWVHRGEVNRNWPCPHQGHRNRPHQVGSQKAVGTQRRPQPSLQVKELLGVALKCDSSRWKNQEGHSKRGNSTSKCPCEDPCCVQRKTHPRTGMWGVGQWTPFPCQWAYGTFPATEMPGEVSGGGGGLEEVIWESRLCY